MKPVCVTWTEPPVLLPVNVVRPDDIDSEQAVQDSGEEVCTIPENPDDDLVPEVQTGTSHAISAPEADINGSDTDLIIIGLTQTSDPEGGVTVDVLISLSHSMIGLSI